MDEIQRVTAATVDILRVLDSSDAPAWGLRVIKESGRPAGTVYPALDRLESAGWLTSSWEVDDSRSGPRRRLYELTAEGAIAARKTIAAYDTPRSSPRAAAVSSI